MSANLRVGIIALILFMTSAQTAVVPFQQFEKNQFCIFSTEPDSAYRRIAYTVLEKAFDEITFDLQYVPPDTYSIYIAPSRQVFTEMVAGSLPEWVGAYAVPTHRIMVIKSPRWNPDNSYEQSLVHELFHLIAHSFMGYVTLPRWLDEGLAIFYAKEERWKTATFLSKAIASRSLIPLDEINLVLNYQRAKADLAYQQSYSATAYLIQTYDIDAVRSLLTSFKERLLIDECFQQATGSTFAAFEQEWRTHIEKTEKWVWFYEINDYLWILIIFLLVAAAGMRFLRNRRIIRQWQKEEIVPFEMPDEEPPEP
jgi:hypothetical protein